MAVHVFAFLGRRPAHEEDAGEDDDERDDGECDASGVQGRRQSHSAQEGK